MYKKITSDTIGMGKLIRLLLTIPFINNTIGHRRIKKLIFENENGRFEIDTEAYRGRIEIHWE